MVYEGYDSEGRRVAVKALHKAGFGDRDMLRKEIRAWRRVAPFCTTKVLHDDLDGPVPFIVSEFVAGPDLRHAVDGGAPYGPEELRRLAIGVATALVAIHRAGVVHRDLKPENILLGSDGPRVIDFGNCPHRRRHRHRRHPHGNSAIHAAPSATAANAATARSTCGDGEPPS